MTPTHYSPDDLVEYFAGALADEQELAIENHLEGCDSCASEAQRVYALVTFARASTAQTIAESSRALLEPVGASAGSGDALVYTAVGWIARGPARALATVDDLVAGWVVVPSLELKAVRLSSRGASGSVAVSRTVPGVGSVHVEAAFHDRDDCQVAIGLGPDAIVRTLVVGLGDAARSSFGTRTVTQEKGQQFHVTAEELGGLHLHLAWLTDDGREETQVIRLPFDVER